MKALPKCVQNLNNQTNQLFTAIIRKDRIFDKALKSGFLEFSRGKHQSAGGKYTPFLIG
jgi:hypothetical protein